MEKVEDKIQVILAQCLQCGERFEKKDIQGKGEHTCTPPSSKS